MSSAKFVAELRPEPKLRRAVHLTTILAFAIGIVVLFRLPIDTLVRILAMLGWSIWLFLTAVHRIAAERRLLRIRLFADGTAALLRPDGSWTPAELAAQSTVLTNLAWLQFNLAGGRPHTELLRGRPREGKNWRRLQVIWRHRENGLHSALGSGS